MIYKNIICLFLFLFIFNNGLVGGINNYNHNNIPHSNNNHYPHNNNNNKYNNNNNNNNNQIQVFLIPHSHCDVGWVQTVEDYFVQNVTLILNNIVEELSNDSTKKFNWAEIVYFKKWYGLQNNQTKDIVKGLIKSKQLYFIGGGWSQNDEAVTDYQAVINQMTLGHQFLLNEFGVKPEIGWQIDPFGPSTLTPMLFALMGFKYHVINRIDERIKYIFNATQMDIPGSGIMSTEKEFEFNWYPSSNNKSLSIFTHVLDHHYSSPYITYENYEFPSFSSSTGFDFEGGSGENPTINNYNLVSRALILLEIIQQRSALFRHNNLLLPFGGDFRYQNSRIEFENMDKLIDYFGNNPHYGVKIRYATLDEYFNQLFNSSESNPSISFPKLSSDDYFVYTQCTYSSYLTSFKSCSNYWSGYYSAYAELKQTVRKSDALLRNAEMLYSLSSSTVIENGNPFNIGLDDIYNTIVQHRNVSGILTHHDAVTGTSKLAVRINYMQMLDSAQYETNNIVIPSLVGLLLANQTINLDYSTNNTIINGAKDGDIYAISFTNSLTWDRYEYVEIEIPQSIKVAVYDYDSNSVASQIVQRMDKNGGSWSLYIQIKTPALGISTYFIVIIDDDDGSDTITNQELLNLIELKFIDKPIISQLVKPKEIIQLSDSSISIGNTLFSLNFRFNPDNNNLLSLYSFDDLQRDQLSIPLAQNYIEYTSYNDSCYTFRPVGLPKNLDSINPKYYISNGTLVQIITIIYTPTCSQSYIVYNSNTTINETINHEQYFEIDNRVAADNNKEVASKFTTSINNDNKFYSSNGLEMMQREYSIKFTDTEPWSIISSNYFPTINTVQILDQSSPSSSSSTNSLLNQLTILTSQSMGVTSQSKGELELLYVRRSASIGATIHEPMNDISNTLIKIKVFFGDPNQIEQIRTPHSLMLENPLLATYSTVNDISIDKWKLMYNTLYSPLSAPSPYNLHLLTFTKQNSTSNSTDSNYFIRFLNIYELNQSQEYSQPIQIPIYNYFKYLNITNIQESTLSINSILNSLNHNDLVTLNPLDLKSFIITLNNKQINNK